MRFRQALGLGFIRSQCKLRKVRQSHMADQNAPGAIKVLTEPDFEAMVIEAHPDDNDFGAGGTSALWASQGKKIVWVVMTNGTEGSEVPSADETELMLTREQEQRASCEILGVQAVEFLRFPDGHLQNTEETRKALVRLIRKYRPRVVMTHDPTQHIFSFESDDNPEETAYINHPDHRATGTIVLDAIFPAVGNPRSYRELLAEDLQPYQVHEVHLFMSIKSDIYVDISETLERKGKALQCHVTQFGAETDMLKEITEWSVGTAKQAKEQKGLTMEHAEAFRRIRLHVPKKTD